MIANLFNIYAQVVEVFPVKRTKSGHNFVRDNSAWTSTCRFFGFLNQVTSWMGPLCLLWLVLYILYIVQGHKLNKKTELSRCELVGIGMCFFLPFTFNWLPFINDYYGFSGNWCWIMVTERICNDTNVTMGFIYILMLYDGPLMVFVLINTIACLIIFHIWWETGSDMKVVIFVIMYPLVYDVLFVIVFTSRLYSIISIRDGRNQSYSLWIAHAMAEPLRVILPSMLVIIQWDFPFTKIMIKNLNRAINEIDEEEPNKNSDLLPEYEELTDD